MSMHLAEDLIHPTPSTPLPTRRQFVATAAGGLMLGFFLPGKFAAQTLSTAAATSQTRLNAFLLIGADNTITLRFGGCELGQGAMSGFAQILAEELVVNWSKVKVITAEPSSVSYITGGSSAIKNNYLPLRQAGAAARAMLLRAAAQTWAVTPSTLTVTDGVVIHSPTNRKLTYGALANLAATLTPPASPAFITDANLRVIGKALPRLDIPSKVNGSAIYGIDVRIPNMVYASIKHCPQFGGTVASMPRSNNGRGNGSGSGTVYVNLGNAVAAVVASDTHSAIEAARGANVTWNIPASAANLDSSVFDTEAANIMAHGPAVNAETVGSVGTWLSASTKTLDATYSFPYLAHACMEVLNCTVDLTATACEIWAPTQAAAWVQATASSLTGLPLGSITVHTTLLGGGLGRKIEQDYIAQAVKVAMAIKKPVKLTWSREEDFGNDMYRPMTLSYVKAGLDGKGNILSWQNRVVSPSILAQKGYIAAGEEDGQATEGATALPYSMTSRVVEYAAHPSPIPIGFWRSVGNSYNAFVVESFIDELAHAEGADPYQFRRNLLINNPRFLAVLDAAAELGNWNSPAPRGHSRGIAIAEAFGTVVAEVIEISNASATSLRLVSVALAVDCGRVINPDSVKAQMEGGILHGLSAALWGHVTFSNGTASVKNFSNYRMLRMSEVPTINVAIINSTDAPSGAGEPAVPPAGPAMANAYFKATGTRIRTLPFFPAQSRMGD